MYAAITVAAEMKANNDAVYGGSHSFIHLPMIPGREIQWFEILNTTSSQRSNVNFTVPIVGDNPNMSVPVKQKTPSCCKLKGRCQRV